MCVLGGCGVDTTSGAPSPAFVWPPVGVLPALECTRDVSVYPPCRSDVSVPALSSALSSCSHVHSKSVILVARENAKYYVLELAHSLVSAGFCMYTISDYSHFFA
jgi:hypothetical protein